MPYIQKDTRKDYDGLIGLILKEIDRHKTYPNGAISYSGLPIGDGEKHRQLPVGDINYIISSIVWTLFAQSKSYKRANDLMGVLESVKAEFYRRRVAPYEDEKIKENGDL